jgi:hypothetical protein
VGYVVFVPARRLFPSSAFGQIGVLNSALGAAVEIRGAHPAAGVRQLLASECVGYVVFVPARRLFQSSAFGQIGVLNFALGAADEICGAHPMARVRQLLASDCVGSSIDLESGVG